MRFTIFGAGSLGTIVAAHLLRAGNQVRVVARGERAEFIRKHGLVVTGLKQLMETCTVVEKVSQELDSDVLIFAVKTYQMDCAVEAAKSVSPRVVLSLANGLKKNQQLDTAFPRSEVLGCMANFSGELLDKGSVEFTRNESFNIDGTRRSGCEIAKIMNESGIVSIADADIISTEWSKFTGWAPLFALSLVSRSSIGSFLSLREFASLALVMISEVSMLAKKKGIALRDDTVLPVSKLSNMSPEQGVEELMKIGTEFLNSFPNHRMSALQDLENGRQVEVHETLGHVVEIARQGDLDIKVIPIFYDLISGLNQILEAR